MNYLIGNDKKGYPDYFLLAAILFLVVVGIVMVFSSSSTVAIYNFNSPVYFLKKQFVKLIISIVLMVVLIKTDYDKIRKITPYLLIISFLFLAALLAGIGAIEINGSRRWFKFPFFNFQPSELMKLSLILYVAALIDKKGAKICSFKDGFLPPFLIYLSAIVLIILEPDLSTSLLISVIVFIMLYIGGVRLLHIIYGAGFLGLLTGIQLLLNPYQLNRIKSFLNSDSGQSYQVKQSLIAIGNGGILGQGLGGSQSKNLYIPEPFTDFIFAIFSEEWGFVGVVIVLSIFIFIFYRGIKISSEAPDKFGKLVAAGITISITLYGLIHAGVVSSLLPTTGLPMPFISYGGSSLLFSTISIGILLNISRSRASAEKAKIIYKKNKKLKR